MAPDPTVMDMVLTELRAIRDSIHELRDTMNSKIGDHANQLAGLAQWKESHEKVADTSAERLTAVERVQNEQNGAIRALRWVGGAVVAGLGLLEAWLHAGRHP